MVARALSQSKPSFRGVRLFNPATDLSGMARVLEEAFRPDNNFLFSNSPLLREVGIFLWTLNYAPGFSNPTDGFVWIEDDRVVGNITLTFDHSHSDQYYFSNIAVKSECRRQGIARALVQTALEHARQHHVRNVFLNVRPGNAGAIKLYQDLGFKALETRGEWRLASPPTPNPLPPILRRSEEGEGGKVRPLRSSDERAISDLVRAATPVRMLPFHRRQTEFEIAWDERIFEAIADFFIGQSTRRWGLEREGKLVALLCARGQRLLASHRLALLVHPEFRGSVEDELVTLGLRELGRFPSREIRADATDAHPEFIAALEHQGFRFLNGLTLMELVL